jgi:hypothetical protein
MARIYKRTGLIEYAMYGVGILLLLNYLGIDLLKPKRENESYDDTKPGFDVNLGNVSYNKEAFERLCTRLVRAMDTEELMEGTDEDEVYNVFGYMHTLDDVHQLYNVFGTRTYGGDEWGQWQLEADPKYNLQTWLNKELEDDEKRIVNKILKDKDIDFKI